MKDLPELRTAVPGPKSSELGKRLKQFESPTVTQVTNKGPIFWERGEGVNIWDADGNRFVDLTSAFGVASLGHSHPRITAAIRTQTEKLSHAMGDVHPSPLKTELCAELSRLTFERWTGGKQRGQTILGNSGFEAVEAAVKTARLFTGKRGIIAFEGGYHGLGLGVLETTWRMEFRHPFYDQLGHFAEFVPFSRQNADAAELEAIEKRIREILGRREVGAILVEPFQGRGGEVIPHAELLQRLRKICDKSRVLLIVDEIYTGFWRTGRWFGVEHSGVLPDLICLGKALTGTLPLSACVGREDVMLAWPPSKGEALHTSTFLGNPLGCAAALASLSLFEKEVPAWKVEEKGKAFLEILKKGLTDVSGIREVRGVGMMMGVELKPESRFSATEWCERLLARGIVALPSGDRGEVLALTPPLTMEMELFAWCVEQIAFVSETRQTA